MSEVNLLDEIALGTDPETLKKMAAKREEEAKLNPTAFHNWFPAVLKAGVRTPKSIQIPFPKSVRSAIMEEEFLQCDELESICQKVRAFGEENGFPLFIKNSLFSSKFYWHETCFVESKETDVKHNIALLTHHWAMLFSELETELVVREIIPTKPIFTAFSKMPITEEFRLFTKGGSVSGWQPYWPESAIENPSTPDWREKLQSISKLSDKDLEFLSQEALKVTDQLEGDWSVDFLRDKHGNFWLIDMAEAHKSYVDKENFNSII